MAASRRVIAQTNPAANTQTTLYTVPASMDVVAALYIAETNNAATTFCVRIKVNGAADDESQFLAKNAAIAAAGVTVLRNIILGDTDVIQVSSVTGDVAFTLMGQENS